VVGPCLQDELSIVRLRCRVHYSHTATYPTAHHPLLC
jgi:hypothetical protein